MLNHFDDDVDAAKTETSESQHQNPEEQRPISAELRDVLFSDDGKDELGVTGRDEVGEVLLLPLRREANSTNLTPAGIRAAASLRTALALSACSNSTTAQMDVKMSWWRLAHWRTSGGIVLPGRKMRINPIAPCWTTPLNISATPSMLALSTANPIATTVRDGLVSSVSGKGATRRTLVPASLTSNSLDKVRQACATTLQSLVTCFTCQQQPKEEN